VVHREEDGSAASLYNFHFATMTAEKRDLVYILYSCRTKKIGERKALWEKEKKSVGLVDVRKLGDDGREENNRTTIHYSVV